MNEFLLLTMSALLTIVFIPGYVIFTMAAKITSIFLEILPDTPEAPCFPGLYAQKDQLVEGTRNPTYNACDSGLPPVPRKVRPSPLDLSGAFALQSAKRHSDKITAFMGDLGSSSQSPLNTRYEFPNIDLSLEQITDREITKNLEFKSPVDAFRSDEHESMLVSITEPSILAGDNHFADKREVEDSPSVIQKAYLDVPLNDFYNKISPCTGFPYSRSKRLERMLLISVQPIDCDAAFMPSSERWRSTATPIPEQMSPLLSPCQLLLAKKLMDWWNGGFEDGGAYIDGDLSDVLTDNITHRYRT